MPLAAQDAAQKKGAGSIGSTRKVNEPGPEAVSPSGPGARIGWRASSRVLFQSAATWAGSVREVRLAAAVTAREAKRADLCTAGGVG